MVNSTIKTNPGAEEAIMPSTKPGTSMLDSKVKLLSQVINKLLYHGMDALINISMLKIAIISDQSAGKLSLVEAISQMKVPCDVGTCT